MSDTTGRSVIIVTVCVALLPTILPMPEWAGPTGRNGSPWYSVLGDRLPHRVGVGSGFRGIVLMC